MATLEQAIAIALQVHQQQIDKSGKPYILHPLRVMLQMDTPEAMIVAVLHDVVEDGDISLDDLRAQGFSEPILCALDSVTRRDGESYEQFVLRAAQDPIGIQVKMADLQDNMNVTRLEKVEERDWKRLQKYLRAFRLLQKRLNQTKATEPPPTPGDPVEPGL